MHREGGIENARELARQLLGDLRAARLAELHTDDIRHWLAERDPLTFDRRRILRTGASEFDYADKGLGRLRELAVAWAGDHGRLIHDLHVAHFRPGAPIPLPLHAQVGKDESADEPEAPDLETLEEEFGRLADDA